jgi:NTE family protein/lysophospholipid hydrolase
MPALPFQLTAFLGSIDLFQGLDESALRDIALHVEPVTLPAGHGLFRRGVRPDAAYIITQGMLAATATGPQEDTRFLSTLVAGESVGGWELLTGDAACADVVVLKEANLLRLDRSAFEAILQSCPAAVESITAAATQQVRRWRLLIALHVSHVFGELDELALRDLANELELLTVAGGDELFHHGDAGDALYVVITGRVRVLASTAGGEVRTISELGTGEIFGEMSLISGESRTATVCAVRDTQVARLSRERYDRFVARHPQAALLTVARTLVLRLREQTVGRERRRHSLATLAVIPAGLDVPLREFADHLARTLAPHGSATHLSSCGVDTALGTQGISQAKGGDKHDLRLIEWLGNQETSHKYLVYETDPTLTPWTRRCLRQADHILIVAQAAGDAALGPIEAWLQETYNRFSSCTRSLVLLQGEAAPLDTARWLQKHAVERHYHLRLHAQADCDRLVRFLLGRAFGLTLGGGFARGLVHIGVIRALREAGITIDAIGGNSMGAMIAAQWALGWDEETMLRKTSTGCAACIRGITLPVVAFKSGNRFSRLVQDLFGDSQIEDLPVPYFCISANLNRAELKVHTQGLLCKAILASTRVPGVFPPIVYDGELHVDGGVIDNVPVDVMRSVIQSGTVVGVDAAPSRVFSPVADYGSALPGWRALWSRVNPFAGKPQWIPNILSIMLRTIEFGGITHNRSAASSADLYLRPPLQQFKPTDFALSEQIVDIGYRHAREALERWQSAGRQRNSA